MKKEYVLKNWDTQETKIVSGDDIELLFDEVVRLTKAGHKFIIYELGCCVGDFT